MHNNVDFPSREAIVDTINMFSNLGVDNQITELDVSIYSNSLPGPIVDYADIPVERFILQGYRYRTFFDAFRELQGKISSVTFWGQADDHTCTSPAQRAAVVRLRPKKKFAYWGLIDRCSYWCGSSAETASRIQCLAVVLRLIRLLFEIT